MRHFGPEPKEWIIDMKNKKKNTWNDKWLKTNLIYEELFDK